MTKNIEEINNIDDIEKEYYIKLILLGESGVGKTNLINIYFDETKFNPFENPTANPTQTCKNIIVNDIKFNISLWDTMGQEKHRAITKTFIKGSNIIIFVYDLTRRETFLELNYWVNTVNEEIGNNEVTFGVAANKIDLFDKSQVEKEEGEEYAKAINALFCETSAKENSKEFRIFVKKLLKKYILEHNICQEVLEMNDQSFHLNENTPKKKKKCCS